MATRRVRIPVLPGRDNNDNAVEGSYTGIGNEDAIGAAGGKSRPKPLATLVANTESTFTSNDKTRLRIARICTRVNSKRNAAIMCCFSTGVWLCQNKRACE